MLNRAVLPSTAIIKLSVKTIFMTYLKSRGSWYLNFYKLDLIGINFLLSLEASYDNLVNDCLLFSGK